MPIETSRPLARQLRLALAGALLTAAAGAAGAAEPAAADSAERVVRIGMVNAQSGPPAAIGQAFLASARAVFGEVNARGGIHGRQLVLYNEDDGYEPDQTVDLTLKLIQRDKVIALLSYVGTANANAVMPLLDDFGVPLVGVLSGSRVLRLPVPRQMFHIRPSYAQEAEILVERLVGNGAMRLAVLYQNDSFGSDVLRGVQQAVESRGLTLAASAGYQRGTAAIKLPLATLLAGRPDAVIIAASDGASFAFIRESRRAGMKARLASVSTFNANAANLLTLRELGERLLISQVVPLLSESAGPLAAECRHALVDYNGEPLSFVSFEGCINARILVKALQMAGPGPTSASLRASLESMHELDFGGVAVSFSAQSHQARSEVYLTEAVDGRIAIAR